MPIDGELSVVKMEDYATPGRDCVRCYREYLAFLLASHIGLDVPSTRLRRDRRYGRLSVQRYLPDATRPTRSVLAQMTITALGIRIALFDVLCQNHDRKPDNLLLCGTDIIPIDFNTAFQTTSRIDEVDHEVDMLLARWFKIHGILSLRPEHRTILLEQARQIAERLNEPTIRACAMQIPQDFCDPDEVELVCNSLTMRHSRLQSLVSAWWDKNVTPIHQFDSDALRTAIHGHLRSP